MTTAVVSAHAEAVFKEIAVAMVRNRISTVPVLDGDRRVIGVVTAADLLARTSHDRGRAPRGHRLPNAVETHRKVHAVQARSLMTWPAVTIAQDATLLAAAAVSAQRHVRCMPVVDRDGVLVGVVSKSDLLKAYLRADEDIRLEVVRDVLDPLLGEDRGDAPAVTVHEGVVTFDGCVERRLLAEEIADRAMSVAGVIDVDRHPSFRVDDVAGANVWPPY